MVSKNIISNCATSCIVGFVTLCLMSALLYTPFFEMNNIEGVSSKDYNHPMRPEPIKITSYVYPIPFTDYYNIQTLDDGWCFLRIKNEKNVVLPRDKYFVFKDYVSDIDNVDVFKRRFNLTSFGYFLSFSLMMFIMTFIVLSLKDVIVGLFQKKGEVNIEEYELLRK